MIRPVYQRYWIHTLFAAVLSLAVPFAVQPVRADTGTPAKHTAKATKQAGARGAADISKAVRVAAAKDCGCGSCAAKGCAPCKGKNCYYCVAKALVADDCGCSHCSASGCGCGPGCDVCKFHLAPSDKGVIGTAEEKK